MLCAVRSFELVLSTAGCQAVAYLGQSVLSVSLVRGTSVAQRHATLIIKAPDAFRCVVLAADMKC